MALNYVEVIHTRNPESGVTPLSLTREWETLQIKTKVMINASGPFLDEVVKRDEVTLQAKTLINRVAGFH